MYKFVYKPKTRELEIDDQLNEDRINTLII